MIKWFKKILGNYLFPYTRFLEKELKSKKDVIKHNKKEISLLREQAHYYDKVIFYNEQVMERMRPMNNEEAKEYLTKNKS